MTTYCGRYRKQSDSLSISRNNHYNINIKAKSNVRNSFVGNPHKFILCELGAVESIVCPKQDPVSVDNLGTVRVFDKNQVRIVDFEKAKRRDEFSSVLFWKRCKHFETIYCTLPLSANRAISWLLRSISAFLRKNTLSKRNWTGRALTRIQSGLSNMRRAWIYSECRVYSRVWRPLKIMSKKEHELRLPDE